MVKTYVVYQLLLKENLLKFTNIFLADFLEVLYKSARRKGFQSVASGILKGLQIEVPVRVFYISSPLRTHALQHAPDTKSPRWITPRFQHPASKGSKTAASRKLKSRILTPQV